MIAFCGLEWDDRCLSFHRTERAVSTPSRWQVRQPIYASSVGRWRRYERHLGPLREALALRAPAGGEIQPKAGSKATILRNASTSSRTRRTPSIDIIAQQ